MNTLINLIGWGGALVLLYLIYLRIDTAQKDFSGVTDKLNNFKL